MENKETKKISEKAIKNLKPNGRGFRTEEEERASQVKGGKASGETRRAQRDMRNAAKALLSMPIADSQKSMKSILKTLGVDEKDMDYSAGILAAMLMAAAKGNVKAATFLRDTAGYKPEEKLEIDADASVHQETKVHIYLPEVEDSEESDE